MDRLQAGDQLDPGDSLASRNGLVSLVLEADGDLVLYRTLFRQPLWASNSSGKGIVRVRMRPDGNLEGVSAAGATQWESGTSGSPGATAVLRDDGNFVVVDAQGVVRWESNTTPDFTAPAVQMVDARGYEFVETSEWLKNAVRGAPCSLLMQWPDYATTIVEDTIDDVDIVIQLWKGWCPHPFRNFPGGIGAEVGVYRRVLGRTAPRNFPPPATPALGASLLVGSMFNTLNDHLWWPAPELETELTYRLINPVTGQTFYEAGPETTYWLAKWMDNDSYARYQRDQGPAWPGLPSWLPGNSRAPLLTSAFELEYTINGKMYPRW